MGTAGVPEAYPVLFNRGSNFCGGGGGGGRVSNWSSYPKYSNGKVWANIIEPDQMPQNAASDQGLHYLLPYSNFRHLR